MNEEHLTAAIWCRWKNVRHIDGLAVGALSRRWTRRDPDLAPLHGHPEFDRLCPSA